MHVDLVKGIVGELNLTLPGRLFGKVFQLSPVSFVIDFGLRAAGYLFIDADPASPRIYLIKRTTRELERTSIPLGVFGQALRSTLSRGRVVSLEQSADDRIVRIDFSVADDLGDPHDAALVVQLTGRSANLFLLNATGEITHSLREPKGEGQRAGEQYRPPRTGQTLNKEKLVAVGEWPTLSVALDHHYSSVQEQAAFESAGKALLQRIDRDISRQQRLKTNLDKDLAAHGEPEVHKRTGDLLLANLSTAERAGEKVFLRDYFTDDAPQIELQIAENDSLQEAAQEAFSRYAKSKRAITEIGKRAAKIADDLKQLAEKRRTVEEAIKTGNESVLAELGDQKPSRPVTKKGNEASSLSGMRQYRSTDGYDVIVGKSGRENDRLTFRVARPNDLWLHAADYPGSHVVVRNTSRKEIPQRTVIEAAQLAARFSQARNDSKVTIHYTQRKFVSKPKGAAPGLVRLSNFKTMTVEPGENIERL